LACGYATTSSAAHQYPYCVPGIPKCENEINGDGFYTGEGEYYHGDDTEPLEVSDVTGLTVTGATYSDGKYYVVKGDPAPTITANIVGAIPADFVKWSSKDLIQDKYITKWTRDPNDQANVSFSTDTACEYLLECWLFGQPVKGQAGSEEVSVVIVVLQPAWIEFDCKMRDNEASAVVTATSGAIWNPRWNDGTPKTRVYFEYNRRVATTVRVNAAQAIADNNGGRLDGDRVAPNGDDFTVTMP